MLCLNSYTLINIHQELLTLSITDSFLKYPNLSVENKGPPAPWEKSDCVCPPHPRLS